VCTNHSTVNIGLVVVQIVAALLLRISVSV
jgi:hypothetical protein